jgi:hypothetical protein
MCGCSVGGNDVLSANVKCFIPQVESDNENFNCDIKSRGSGGNINIRIIAVTKWRQSSEFGILKANRDCRLYNSIVVCAVADLWYILLRGIVRSLLRRSLPSL